ncbi:MAG: SUMF1/EgtB/PvdO family nonheme iron enzyme, partial [bacterium]|nr:SUMF1/EgtB/PvdO family nonheme iron enzyme [bacterium]
SARRARHRALARTTEPSPPPVGKGRWAWVAAAAVLVAVVLFVVFGDWRSPEPEGGEIAESTNQAAAAVEAGADPGASNEQEPPDDETPADQEAESVGAPAEQDVPEVAVPAAAIETETDEQPAAQESVVSPPRNEVVEKPPKATPSSWQDPKIGMRFRYIPSGSFTMGSPENEPGRDDDETQHEVTLTRAFWMAETEVTQAQWRTVMRTDPSRFARCGDECPVERVSWYDAVTFANRLSEMNGYENC